MRRPILLTTLFATPGLLQEQEGAPFSIGNIKGEGSGCPTDSWALFVEAGQFGFTEFSATIGLEDEKSHLDCKLSIELNDVVEGYRVVLRQVNVVGKAGMDTGVQATIRTTTSWTDEEGSELSEDQVLLGSAVGIEFPLDFQAGGTFAEQASVCGDSSVELNINLDVAVEREGDEGQGQVTVDSAALRLDIEPCEIQGEAPVDEPTEEAPVEETPAEGSEDECVVDDEGEAANEDAPVEEEPVVECGEEEDVVDEPVEPEEPEEVVEEEPAEETPVEEPPADEGHAHGP
ncbi:hypothetical protein jhhlp_007787 [Lomentospora prolificans]|uniref:Uncharacterized protein n=1 Tax=Lomentospora prolificans TaxID=41688 RepID=A0A2N3N0K1_9PEZI|nr:hypothetical protein jhhlp_007787 [Lomentospora prolificans]